MKSPSIRQWTIAARALCRRPGYSLTALFMLVVGIGATSTLSSVVDTILLKPLPYPNADRLVLVLEASPMKDKKDSLIAPVRLDDWNRLNQTFEALSGTYNENVTDTSGAAPERLTGHRTAPRFFSVFEAVPLVGRTFTNEEELSGGPNVAVIGYGLWTRRYGQSRDVIGKRLVFGGDGYTIIGVMPREFTSPNIDVWIPAQFAPFWANLREARFMTGYGRLRPGVTLAQARADLARVQLRLGEQFPRTDKNWSALVTDLKDEYVGDHRRTLLLVFGAVSLLLLIAIANIAGLTLAQLHQREREMAIRGSVGASRAQVVAGVMREVLVLAGVGAILGAAAAYAGVNLMLKVFADLPRMTELAFNWRAVAFTALATLAASVFFGLIPALHSTRADLARLLGESSRGVAGGRRGLQRSLVIAQLALTLLLLASAGLLLRSLMNLTHVDPGFDSSNVVTFHVGAAWNEDRTMIGNLQLRILDELHRLPNVEAAGITNFLPASGPTLRSQIQIPGVTDTRDGTYSIGSRTVSVGYLQALHVPLLAGEWCPAMRPFSPNGANKWLVNRAFVDQYAKGQNLVGRHGLYSAYAQSNAPMNEIVGVIGNIREDDLAETPSPFVYECSSAGSWPDPEYVVRVKGAPAQFTRNLRQIVGKIAANRAVFGVKPLDAVLQGNLAQPRLNARFLALFAATAMLLAAVGLYSLISLIVTSRTRELGVRIALGATAPRIMSLVLRDAGGMLAAGILLGVILTLAAERLIKMVLFGVSPLDAGIIAMAVVILCAVAGLAAFLPARRAAAIDPLDAIRAE